MWGSTHKDIYRSTQNMISDTKLISQLMGRCEGLSKTSTPLMAKICPLDLAPPYTVAKMIIIIGNQCWMKFSLGNFANSYSK